LAVIQSFGDAFTEDIYDGTVNARTKRFPGQLVQTATRKLDLLNAAVDLRDLRVPPGNRLEALKGTLAGFHSIRINDQWRIVFRWTTAGPELVRITDYH
jgi:toxin HigB-1